jgi:hypothetical protein
VIGALRLVAYPKRGAAQVGRPRVLRVARRRKLPARGGGCVLFWAYVGGVFTLSAAEDVLDGGVYLDVCGASGPEEDFVGADACDGLEGLGCFGVLGEGLESGASSEALLGR